MDTTIRNLDEQVYRAMRSRAVLEGRTVGDLLNEMMRVYLVRVPVQRGMGSIRELQPEPFPEGNEQLSQEIDSVCLRPAIAVIVLDFSFLIGFITNAMSTRRLSF